MAYAAITSLMSTIQQSMELSGCNLQSSYEKLESLRAIMEKSCTITGDLEALTSLEAEIAEVAYSTEDMIESESRKVSLVKTSVTRRIDFWELCFSLKQAVEHIGSTMNKWKEMQNKYNNIKDLKVQNMSLGDVSRLAVETENVMVGHENEFEMMQDQYKRWTVEGFLKVEKTKTIEEVAETCLKDLIDRSLIFIHHFTFDGKIKSCGMHDVTRELCLREARNMNFVNVIKRKNDRNPCAQFINFSSNSRGRISINDASRGILKRFPPLILPPPDAFPQNLKKLAFAVEGFEHCYCTEPVGISTKQIQQDIEDNYGAYVEVRIS
ncbi:hypothetical protein MTR67_053243 [Solanum verrucosum]|uniref:Disease resistance protein winged helix domain-containing protein n=1 Tax=Solanum verrucosum TaxID=315347 RepID=A0AAF0V6L7_SOLVR|nr:hypothetical protein MTR67_053243 [Solanum verrucosum]